MWGAKMGVCVCGFVVVDGENREGWLMDEGIKSGVGLVWNGGEG